MSEGKELATIRQMPAAGLSISTDAGLNHAYRIAKALQGSGLFPDTPSAQTAMAKIIAGVEFGIGPFAAMSQIHVIDGKPAPGATLIAALIRKSGRYRFTQLESTNEKCVLEFFSRDTDGSWLSEGTVEFTMDDARDAGWAGKKNWQRHPSDMLFARALTRGARRFCADVFGGIPAYTPADFGEDEPATVPVVLDEDVAEATVVDADVIDDAEFEDLPVSPVEAAEFDDAIDEDPLTGGEVRRFPVTGSKGDEYTVSVYTDGTWDCTCPARTPDCKHVKGVRRVTPDGEPLWPGDDGYDNVPPAGQKPPPTVVEDDPTAPSDTGGVLAVLLDFGKRIGLTEQQAIGMIAQHGDLGEKPTQAALGVIQSQMRAGASELGVYKEG